jgi:hypothetical protein
VATRRSTKRKKKDRAKGIKILYNKKNVKRSVVDPDPDVFGTPVSLSVIICTYLNPPINKQKSKDKFLFPQYIVTSF